MDSVFWRLIPPAARLTTYLHAGERFHRTKTQRCHVCAQHDGGLTFSAPHKVNDDPVNPSKWHWFGTFAVAPNGGSMLLGTTRETLRITPIRSYFIPSVPTQDDLVG